MTTSESLDWPPRFPVAVTILLRGKNGFLQVRFHRRTLTAMCSSAVRAQETQREPYRLLLAALGSSLVTTFRRVSDERGMQTHAIQLRLGSPNSGADADSGEIPLIVHGELLVEGAADESTLAELFSQSQHQSTIGYLLASHGCELKVWCRKQYFMPPVH